MGRRFTIKLSSLVGTEQYQPTGLQIQVLCAFLESMANRERLGTVSPTDILASLGRDKSNWYQWIKKPGFMNWWNQAIDEYFSGHGLREVHQAIYKRAITNSPTDAKMFLERFDPQYKPVTGSEHTFRGIRPPEQATPEEIEAAIARSKALANSMQSTCKQIPSQPVIPALPAIKEERSDQDQSQNVNRESNDQAI